MQNNLLPGFIIPDYYEKKRKSSSSENLKRECGPYTAPGSREIAMTTGPISPMSIPFFRCHYQDTRTN